MGCFTVGLDLGQAQDFSALAVVERVAVLPDAMSVERFDEVVRRAQRDVRVSWQVPQVQEEWHIRHVQRWELGTGYPVVVDDVCRLMRTEALRDGLLLIDRTGIGRAVTDLLRDAFLADRMGTQWPAAVTITAGEKRHGLNIPKSDLIDGLLLPLQQGRLHAAQSLPLADVLDRELTSFRQKVSASGAVSFDHGRSEGHGDIVMALALALSVQNRVVWPRTISNFPGWSRAAVSNPLEGR